MIACARPGQCERLKHAVIRTTYEFRLIHHWRHDHLGASNALVECSAEELLSLDRKLSGLCHYCSRSIGFDGHCVCASGDATEGFWSGGENGTAAQVGPDEGQQIG